MRRLKIALTVIVAAFLCNQLNGQTCQTELHGTFDRIYVICGLGPISGDLTVHVSYHLNPKTGYLENLHFNIPKYSIWNSDTGEKFKLVDTGNDNGGFYWYYFNYINACNGPGGMQYDITDGWLDGVMPPELPDEGRYVEMSLKFIAYGNVYRYSSKYTINLNANGELVVNKYMENIDCE